MKKNILKKIFIKIAKILNFEVIDQNTFTSPTLNKKLNEKLSTLNQKSIVLPLGEVKITKKIKKVLLIIRVNTNVDIWDQNKKRLFEYPKLEYTIRSLNSLVKSITFCEKNSEDLDFKINIIDDRSNNENLIKIKKLLEESKIKYEIISLNHEKYKNTIKNQKNTQTFSNLASLLQAFELAKKDTSDLIFFLEDDYIHFESMVSEIINSYQRIASQLNKDIFLCPADYPYLYMENEKSNIFIGDKRHWRTVNKTLCTFITTNKIVNKYWDNFYNTCLDRNEPFEKFLNEIYESEFCLSPIKTLSLHMTNINSSYGLSPFIDYKKLWESSKYNG
tara:strand:+ start:10 stop:1008 length:999 start_codon:yes stop_codon:yes gene_type:complete